VRLRAPLSLRKETMKAYRLHNRSEPGPASPLHFLSKAGADGYRDYFRWPYQNTGRYPLHQGGSIPVADLDLRTEEVEVKAVLAPELDLLFVERDGAIGVCYLLPGDCFNPDDWAPANPLELGHPEAGKLLAEAQKRLRG
jgi:hypothetical protein